jgi:ABC-type polysaccharide/polyol phosphate export permease
MTPQYDVALTDFLDGMRNWRMWGRLGWQETKRRYRRTMIGPFWTTLSLGIFIFTLGLVWAQLWKQDSKIYLPFLCSGMLVWVMLSTIMTEGCAVFTAAEGLIKQLRFPYTLLACSVVWRNFIVFLHNLLIFILVAIYAQVPLTRHSFLVVPGLLLVFLNGIWVVTLLGLLCSRFRDMQQIVTSILQVAMFVTPILWTAQQLGPRFTKFVDYNLLFHYVEIVRAPLLGQAPSDWSWFVTVVGTVLGWGFTLYLFSCFRRRMPYWL